MGGLVSKKGTGGASVQEIARPSRGGSNAFHGRGLGDGSGTVGGRSDGAPIEIVQEEQDEEGFGRHRSISERALGATSSTAGTGAAGPRRSRVGSATSAGGSSNASGERERDRDRDRRASGGIGFMPRSGSQVQRNSVSQASGNSNSNSNSNGGLNEQRRNSTQSVGARSAPAGSPFMEGLPTPMSPSMAADVGQSLHLSSSALDAAMIGSPALSSGSQQRRTSAADKIKSFFPIRFSLRNHGIWAELLETLHTDLTEQIHTFDQDWSAKVLDNVGRLIARAFRQPTVVGDTLSVSFHDMRLGDQIIDAFFQVLVAHETFGRVGSICVRNNYLSGLCIDGAIHLLQFSTYLCSLDLSCNPLGDEGVIRLSKALRSNIILQNLNISYVAATDRAADELAELILANKVLHTLDLSGNSFQREGIVSILNAATANTTLISLALHATAGLDRMAFHRLEEVLCRNVRLGPSSSSTSAPLPSSANGPGSPPQPSAFSVSMQGSPILPSAAAFSSYEWTCHDKAAPTVCCSSFRDGPEIFTILTNATITTLPPERNIPIPPPERRASVFSQKEVPRSIELLFATPETVSFMNSLPFNKTWKREGRFSVGCADTIGRRSSMEDVMVICENFQNQKGNYVMALFDGHGGPDAANYAAEQIVQTMSYIYDTEGSRLDHVAIVRKTFIELYESMQGYLFCGTTAATLSILGDKLFVASAGDSRIVLSRGGEAIRMSRDHKPTLPDERKRITDEGGFIKDGRVNGVLSVSRVLGDGFLHPLVSCEPHITVTDLLLGNPYAPVDPENPIADILDEFIIIACDGLWDVLSDAEAVSLVHYSNYWDYPELAAQNLRNVAYEIGSTDNISVMVVSLRPPSSVPPSSSLSIHYINQPPPTPLAHQPVPPVGASPKSSDSMTDTPPPKVISAVTEVEPVQES